MQTYYVATFSLFLVGGAVFFGQSYDSDVKREPVVAGEAVALSHRHAIVRAESALSGWNGISDAILEVPDGPFANSEYVESILYVKMGAAPGDDPEATLYTWSLPSLRDSRNVMMGGGAKKAADDGVMIGVMGHDEILDDVEIPDMGGAVIPDGAVLAISKIRSGE